MSSEEIPLIRQQDSRLSFPEMGLQRQVLAYTDKLMLVRHQMKKGWVGTKHAHPHEQLVYVVSGHIRFTGGGRTFDAFAGDSFVVPGSVEHQAIALADSEVLDVFAPFREEYAAEGRKDAAI